MDIVAVRDALVKFAKRYKTELHSLSSQKSQLLEIGSLAMCAEHYRLAGYTVIPQNEQSGSFRVKLGSRGYPWNFSWFKCERDGQVIELHANLAVYSKYRQDDGVYVVDVGVSKGGAIPRKKAAQEWRAIENQSLITFAEAKALVIYPMLLAQFIGIVHEITPTFLKACSPCGFREEEHFYPALISVGYLHGTARKIVDAYPERGYLVKVVPDMEGKLSWLRQDVGLATSVLATRYEEDRELPF